MVEELPTEPLSKRTAPGDEGSTTRTAWVSLDDMADGAKTAGLDGFSLPESVLVGGDPFMRDDSSAMGNYYAVSVRFCNGERYLSVAKWRKTTEYPFPNKQTATGLLMQTASDAPAELDEWELDVDGMHCICYGTEPEHAIVTVSATPGESDYGYVIMGTDKVMLTDDEVRNVLAQID